MATNEKIKTAMQKLNFGSALVDLFTIDLTPIGESTTYNFTPMVSGGNIVTFNGVNYFPLPVEFDGEQHPGDGQMPRPKIRVSNINKTFIAALNSYNDLVGCKLTRKRTFEKYLDDGISADANAQFPEDIYYIERKTRQNKYLIEWELKAAVDIEGVFIPRGQCLDLCDHRYRVWDSDSNSFDYTDATCPYTSNDSFDEEGNATSRPNDKCAKKIYDCILRYGTYRDLPFRGFPGVGKIGIPYRR